MIIVGFTNKTSKILPRIICHRFRHCAPITIDAHGAMILHQFVRRGHIAQIPITMRDIRILRLNGWRFVCIPCINVNAVPRNACTCVAFTWRTINGRGIPPITPYGLYKKIAKWRFF